MGTSAEQFGRQVRGEFEIGLNQVKEGLKRIDDVIGKTGGTSRRI